MTGSWIHTWEFHDGTRGWLVPAVLTVPIAIGHSLAPASLWHIYLTRGLLAVLSLAIPLAWYDLVSHLGRRHALIAAYVAAIWCEVFYFGVRPSAEGMGMTVLFPAMALAQRLARRPDVREAALLGLLLAIGMIVRFHYLPVIGLIAVWGLRGAWRPLARPFALGWAAGLLLGSLADIVTGHAPLIWIWRSVAFNLVTGGSDVFGTQPPWWFVTFQAKTWGWAALVLVPLIAAGARRMPVLALVALAVFAPHALIAHKEYRFVILGTTTLILLAVIGSVDLGDRLDRALAARSSRPVRAVVPLLLAGWLTIDCVVALGPVFVAYWGQGDKVLTTLALAGEQPGLCGLAIYRRPAHPALAMSYVNRDVTALLFDGPEAADQARAMAPRYNVAIASAVDGQSLPAGFHRIACWRQDQRPVAARRECVFARAGGCAGGLGDFGYQAALTRRGK